MDKVDREIVAYYGEGEIRYLLESIPPADIRMMLLGTVNAAPFRHWSAQSLRFLGCIWDPDTVAPVMVVFQHGANCFARPNLTPEPSFFCPYRAEDWMALEPFLAPDPLPR